MFKFQKRLAVLTVPAVLALGAVSYGSVVAFASPNPQPGVTAPPGDHRRRGVGPRASPVATGVRGQH